MYQLTLQGIEINQMNAVGDSQTYQQLTEVPQLLRKFFRQAYDVVLRQKSTRLFCEK